MLLSASKYCHGCSFSYFISASVFSKLFDSSACSVGRSPNSASLWHQQPKESNSGTGRKESQHYFIWCRQWVHFLCRLFSELNSVHLFSLPLQKVYLGSVVAESQCIVNLALISRQIPILLNFFHCSGSGASSGPGSHGHLLQPGSVLLCRFSHLCAGKHLQWICRAQCGKNKKENCGKSI